MNQERRNLVAQWAFDTRPILLRFHLWLEDVELEAVTGSTLREHQALSFVGPGLEKAFVMATAVTALGTRLFGRWGEGSELDRAGLNRVKKDADAASAYALSEALWHLTRNLPENHAVMVSLGEGLMPKMGETPEMGSNPLLGFGRVYARPQVARFLEKRVHELINDPTATWEGFRRAVQAEGLTVWGAAIDTLENTSRFARGKPSGPMAVLHLFDQPLVVCRPYEGYVGCLALPKEVVLRAADDALLVDYRTPRGKVMEAIRWTYDGIRPEHVHVWTLGGEQRRHRIGGLWDEWTEAGAHLVTPGWQVPGGLPAFCSSGTYAPTYRVGPYRDDAGEQHLFLVDGYAASAEAIQAASLDPVLGLETSLCIFSSRFELPYSAEKHLMRFGPDHPDFGTGLQRLFEHPLAPERIEDYRRTIRAAHQANMPLHRRTVGVDDFFPEKRWEGLALAGYMLPDPYTGAPGVEDLGGGRYRVVTQAASSRGIQRVTLTLRLQECLEESRLVFSPLLDRFYAGQDYRLRAVRISDSGRIRNELQTLASEAIEYTERGGIRLHLERVDDAVLPPDKKTLIREVLAWYKDQHPIWFRWLELA